MTQLNICINKENDETYVKSELMVKLGAMNYYISFNFLIFSLETLFTIIT